MILCALCGNMAFRLHTRIRAATALRALLLAGAMLTPGWAAGQKTLTLHGMVVEDSSAMPLAGAEIVLNGGAHRATSDDKGAFTIAGLSEGEQVITIRLLGFTPLTTAFTLTSENASSIIEFGLVRTVQQLAPAEIVGRRDPLERGKLAEFFRRREMGSGTFLTRDVFENATSQRTSEILKQRIAGLRLVLSPCSSAVYAVATRGSGSIENRAHLRDCGNPPRVIDRGCPASVYLDGVPVYRAVSEEPPFNINQINPGEISAVEYYAGTAQLPSEFRYSAKTCAVLVFWTR